MNAHSDLRWKVLAGSVTGTSHQRAGNPCQDYCQFTLVGIGERAAIVLVCADGAGSASQADVGAKLACRTVTTIAAAAINDGLPVSAISSEIMADWYERARRRLSLEACLVGFDLREFACTLLVAIVDNGRAVFTQLGDGAVVFRVGDGYQTAFWPQSGDYVNTTNFLTASDFRRHLAFRMVEFDLEEVALFTDGLQPLALHNATRTVHSPFFEPMFATLRKNPNPDELELPLRQFLASKLVTDRTDDDTTLILAARGLPNHESS